jgi:hypothetical protein
MDFNKKKYIESGIYVDNMYLIQPDTAAKRCNCCNELQFAIEYPMVKEAPDGCFCVCITCWRSRLKKEKVELILKEWPVTRVCRKCEQELGATMFRSYSKTKNMIENICVNCSPVRPEFWKKEGELEE